MADDIGLPKKRAPPLERTVRVTPPLEGTGRVSPADGTAMPNSMQNSTEEVRVNFRWKAAPVAVVKRAAALAGIPYQSYIKLVAFRQAVADLKAAGEAGVHEPFRFEEPKEEDT